MHAFRKLRARIFRIRKTRVYDTARSVCTKAMWKRSEKKRKKKAFGITEKKRGKGGRSGIGGKYRSKNIR